jgi:DNA-binding GntR family transcriptional regulator
LSRPDRKSSIFGIPNLYQTRFKMRASARDLPSARGSRRDGVPLGRDGHLRESDRTVPGAVAATRSVLCSSARRRALGVELRHVSHFIGLRRAGFFRDSSLVMYSLLHMADRKKPHLRSRIRRRTVLPRREGAARGVRESLVDRAYREIRRRILDNEYPPGHHVLEHELAAELSMSRTPVREALIRLKNEKFIQIIPRHGMCVVPLSLDELRDIYEILTALELMAIERLIRSGPDGKALSALDQSIEEMDLAVERHNTDARLRAIERFHRTLIDLCGNTRLASVAYMMWDQGHRARMATSRLRSDLEQSNLEYRAVVDAIRRGDAQEATARHREHRERTSPSDHYPA